MHGRNFHQLRPVGTKTKTADLMNRLVKPTVSILALLVLADPARAQDASIETSAAMSAPSAAVQHSLDQRTAYRLVESLGPWAFAAAPLMMITVAILPIPAEIPAMINGMLFSLALATFITWSGAVVGALISFEISRRYGRPLAGRWLSERSLERADRLVRSAGWSGLLVLRLIPLVAFTAMNWAAGITAMKRWTFVWTTAVGILPGAILFTTSGTGLAALYRIQPALAGIIALLGVMVIWTCCRRYTQTAPENI